MAVGDGDVEDLGVTAEMTVIQDAGVACGGVEMDRSGDVLCQVVYNCCRGRLGREERSFSVEQEC